MKRAMVVVLLLAGTSIAAADVVAPPPETPQPPPAAAPAPAGVGPRITLMWAPIRLIIPLAEITAEYRVMAKLGVSIELGGGTRTLTASTATNQGTDVKGTELEGGAQVRYYLLGDFRKGVQLGGEILDEHVKFGTLPANVMGAAAGGVTAGPFVGYKIATHMGFTFEGQLGARYLIVDPPVTGQGSPMISSRWEPLLHLNIGWSF